MSKHYLYVDDCLYWYGLDIGLRSAIMAKGGRPNAILTFPKINTKVIPLDYGFYWAITGQPLWTVVYPSHSIGLHGHKWQ